MSSNSILHYTKYGQTVLSIIGEIGPCNWREIRKAILQYDGAVNSFNGMPFGAVHHACQDTLTHTISELLDEKLIHVSFDGNTLSFHKDRMSEYISWSDKHEFSCSYSGLEALKCVAVDNIGDIFSDLYGFLISISRIKPDLGFSRMSVWLQILEDPLVKLEALSSVSTIEFIICFRRFELALKAYQDLINKPDSLRRTFEALMETIQGTEFKSFINYHFQRIVDYFNKTLRYYEDCLETSHEIWTEQIRDTVQNLDATLHTMETFKSILDKFGIEYFDKNYDISKMVEWKLSRS